MPIHKHQNMLIESYTWIVKVSQYNTRTRHKYAWIYILTKHFTVNSQLSAQSHLSTRIAISVHLTNQCPCQILFIHSLFFNFNHMIKMYLKTFWILFKSLTINKHPKQIRAPAQISTHPKNRFCEISIPLLKGMVPSISNLKKWIPHIKISQKKFVWHFKKFMHAQNLPLKFTPTVVLSDRTRGHLNMWRHCREVFRIKVQRKRSWL